MAQADILSKMRKLRISDLIPTYYIQYTDGEKILNDLKQPMYYHSKKGAIKGAKFYANKVSKSVEIYTKLEGEKYRYTIIHPD